MVKIGATGEFPDGKLDEDDEGALRMRIGNDGKSVRLDFGEPIAWLAFGPDDAMMFATLLISHAESCWRSQKKDKRDEEC
jgi:hypothetical protein